MFFFSRAAATSPPSAHSSPPPRPTNVVPPASLPGRHQFLPASPPAPRRPLPASPPVPVLRPGVQPSLVQPFPTGGWCSWKRRRRITREGDPVHCPMASFLCTHPGRACLPSIKPRL
ncbi:hypothetical protein SEVIR_7G008752v4 [Setaria viridis]